MHSFNIQGREVKIFLVNLQESNQSNSESPKKASIDSNSVPRTLMRSGSIGEQLLNFCQKESSCVMSLQLLTSSSRWTSRMSQKCWFCTQAVLLVGNLTYFWNIFINCALCWIILCSFLRHGKELCRRLGSSTKCDGISDSKDCHNARWGLFQGGEDKLWLKIATTMTNYDWKLTPRWQIMTENCHHNDKLWLKIVTMMTNYD